MNLLEECTVDCPYCGEAFTVNVDCSGESHDFIEDCAVCCQPIELRARIDGGRLLSLNARRDDE